jgi:hypothetical protein
MRCKPNFPCNICEGDHLTHMCSSILMVLRARCFSEGSSSLESPLVFQQSIYPLVDKVVGSMQYSTDPTLVLCGDSSLDNFVS